MGRDLHYDVMLEVEGVLRSRRVRMRFDRELELGETLEIDGRRWRVVGPVTVVFKADLDGKDLTDGSH